MVERLISVGFGRDCNCRIFNFFSSTFCVHLSCDVDMSHNVNNIVRSQRRARASASLRERCRSQEVPVVSWRWVRHAKDTPNCRCLGRGTYGDVFLVRHPAVPSRRLVVKHFRGKHKEMVNELEALLRVQDVPGVQRLVGVCLDTKEIITEYAGSTMLLEILLGNLSSMKDKLWMIVQLLTIVDRLHKKGLCHNDLKLNNICICPTPSSLYKVTLIDFGFARTIGSVVFQKPIRHPHEIYFWISPEVAGRGRCSPASDVFSVGTILFGLFSRFRCPYKVKRWITHAMSLKAEERPSLQEGVNIIMTLLYADHPKSCVVLTDPHKENTPPKRSDGGQPVCSGPSEIDSYERGTQT